MWNQSFCSIYRIGILSHLSFFKLDLQHRMWRKTANDELVEARDTSHVGPCFKGHITKGLGSIA